jgi:NADPH2:quinone reductase
VVAVAAPADEDLVRGLGADVFVPRGDGAPAAIRRAVPDGVDGLIDAALLGPPAVAAIRDGGTLAAVRTFAGETERGIRIVAVSYARYRHERGKLDDASNSARHASSQQIVVSGSAAGSRIWP